MFGIGKPKLPEPPKEFKKGINEFVVSGLLQRVKPVIEWKKKVRKMEKINAQELTDVEVAKLWRSLDGVNEALHQLQQTSNWMKKGEQAEVVLTEMRDLLSCLTHAVHKLKNDSAFIKRQIKGAENE